MTRAHPPASATTGAVMTPISAFDHQGDVAWSDLRLRRRLHPDGEWLAEGAFGEADVARQLVGEGFRVNDISREAAMHRRRRSEGDAGIDVVEAHARGVRGHVWNAHRPRGRLGLKNRNRVRTRALGQRLRWCRTCPFLSEALRCERRLRTWFPRARLRLRRSRHARPPICCTLFVDWFEERPNDPFARPHDGLLWPSAYLMSPILLCRSMHSSTLSLV
jgi:hypothetical protein